MGAQVEVLNAPHRHGKGVLREDELEQGTRGDNRQVGVVFEEIAQSGQGVGSGLDLVEEEHAARRQQRLTQQPFELPADARQVQGPEDGLQVRVALEVDLVQTQSPGPGELPHQGGLAHLAGAADDQRFPLRGGEPSLQGAFGRSVHDECKYPLFRTDNVQNRGYFTTLLSLAPQAEAPE